MREIICAFAVSLVYFISSLISLITVFILENIEFKKNRRYLLVIIDEINSYKGIINTINFIEDAFIKYIGTPQFNLRDFKILKNNLKSYYDLISENNIKADILLLKNNAAHIIIEQKQENGYVKDITLTGIEVLKNTKITEETVVIFPYTHIKLEIPYDKG